MARASRARASSHSTRPSPPAPTPTRGAAATARSRSRSPLLALRRARRARWALLARGQPTRYAQAGGSLRVAAASVVVVVEARLESDRLTALSSGDACVRGPHRPLVTDREEEPIGSADGRVD